MPGLASKTFFMASCLPVEMMQPQYWLKILELYYFWTRKMGTVASKVNWCLVRDYKP